MKLEGVKLALLTLVVAIEACRKTAPAPPLPASEDSPESLAVAEAIDASVPVLPRCTLAPGEAALGMGPIEIGEAVATPHGVAIGLTHGSPSGRSAAVAWVTLGASLPPPAVLDLAASRGDDPPPRPIARGEDLYAVAYAGGTSAARELVVSKNTARNATVMATISRPRSESLAFDAALGEKGGLLTWDEDAAPARGVIRVASFLGAAEKSASRVVSPEGSDAESPRVASRPGGYWVAWIARALEPVHDGGKNDPEAPGEDRAYSWVELATLDELGVAVGPVQRVTPAKEHVDAFDLDARSTGADLDVLARNDEEPRAGAGGRLVLYSVHGQTITNRVLVESGVGPGIPDLLSPMWLVFPDAADRLRLLPLRPVGSPAGVASIEPVLEGARPLAVTGAGLLAAFPADPGHLFRQVACVR